MDRVNRILHNPRYRECVEKNRKYEEERIFCRHDMSHFLDVARLSWIENLEKGLGIEKVLFGGRPAAGAFRRACKTGPAFLIRPVKHPAQALLLCQLFFPVP